MNCGDLTIANPPLPLFLLVTHRVFLAPMLHNQVVSIDGEPFILEQDLGNRIAIDFKIEILVSGIDLVRTSLE